MPVAYRIIANRPPGKGAMVDRYAKRKQFGFRTSVSSVDHPGVNYVVVRGDKTVFPKSGLIRLTDITDGLENTIMVFESITCGPDWTACDCGW